MVVSFGYLFSSWFAGLVVCGLFGLVWLLLGVLLGWTWRLVDYGCDVCLTDLLVAAGSGLLLFVVCLSLVLV